MRYHDIKKFDMNNGDGIRVTLFVSGCEHHCADCQNPQTWDFESGNQFDEAELVELAEELDKDFIAGITISGGDPLAPLNRNDVLNLVLWVKKNYPEKTIWIYTGYPYEHLVYSGNLNILNILRSTDVLVDGEYQKDLRNLQLKWRGSSNQRVIDVKKSLKENKVILWCE